MNSLFHLKIWALPYRKAVVDQDLEVGTRSLAEAASLVKLKKLGGFADLWMEPLRNGFYRYGVGQVWLGLVFIENIGYAPG